MPEPLRPLLRPLVSALALVLGLVLVFVLGLGLAAPGPAQAAGDDVQLALCKQVLSRMLCKKQNDFGYVGKAGDGIYILTVFYASKNSEYLCAVMPDGQLIVQDRTWHAMRRVIPFTMDSEGKCFKSSYSSSECPVKAAFTVCPPKTAQDAKEQVKETFWVRPIPKILEEEYKAMTAQPNATAPAPAEP